MRQIVLRSAAEEVFQETWMRIIASRSRYRVEARFATFLYHVAHNCVMDHFRSRPPLQLISLDDDPEEAIQVAGPDCEQPERAAGARESARQLLHALAALPMEQREAFLLQQEGGLTPRKSPTLPAREGNRQKPVALCAGPAARGNEL
jgi:RNA polymerase sigma-70 factor (ECF subfamily)